MASIPGGQFTFYTNDKFVSVVTSPDGSGLPPAIADKFNLEMLTSGSWGGAVPAGYQGVAVLSADGRTIELASGDYGVSVTDDGPDTIIAGSGNDTILGGGGPELILGGSGKDLIFGGWGQDTIIAGSGPTTIFGGLAGQVINGGSGPDVIYGGGYLYGGSGHDTITAGSGPTTIYGGQNGDVINGGSGLDVIHGGSGDDTIHGGTGPETIDGGSGDNLIVAGSGGTLIEDNGTQGHDTVVGFDTAHGDAISFSGQDAATVDQVVATATVSGGSTTITLPDGTTMTLVGISHIDSTFFH